MVNIFENGDCKFSAFFKKQLFLLWTLALPSSCGERRNLVTSTRSVEDWRGGSAKASGEDMKYIEGQRE